MTIDEMIAILQAAKEGKQIEFRCLYRNCDDAWRPTNNPSWEFGSNEYRIATSPIAGHNPDQLTEEQVGVKDGWRLLSKEEVATGGKRRGTNYADFYDTQWWDQTIDGWRELGIWSANEKQCTLRTKHPAGYFLPKPKTRKPLGPDDFPPGIVVRTHASQWIAVQEVGPIGVWLCGIELIDYESLARDDNWERSLDGGRTWLPCYTEE